MRLISIVCLAVCVLAVSLHAAENEKPYKCAKVGDTLTYNTHSTNVKLHAKYCGTMILVITETGPKKLVFSNERTWLSFNDIPRPNPKSNVSVKTIDPTGEFHPTETISGVVELKKIDEGRETLKIGDKEYECRWILYNFKSEEEQGDGSGESTIKVWLNNGVPGPIKLVSTVKGKHGDSVHFCELNDFQNRKPLIPSRKFPIPIHDSNP